MTCTTTVHNFVPGQLRFLSTLFWFILSTELKLGREFCWVMFLYSPIRQILQEILMRVLFCVKVIKLIKWFYCFSLNNICFFVLCLLSCEMLYSGPSSYCSCVSSFFSPLPSCCSFIRIMREKQLTVSKLHIQFHHVCFLLSTKFSIVTSAADFGTKMTEMCLCSSIM